MIQQLDRAQRITGDDLPNELLLRIFTYMPLQSLIAARGIDRRWRALVSEAFIHPARKQLLDLYLQCLDTPSFLESRDAILPHVAPFDRDAYMHWLPPNPPVDFDLWVREWPSYAVMGWIWPGLEDVGECRGWTFWCRCNCLGHTPPYIKNITFHERIKTDPPSGADNPSKLASDSDNAVIYHAAAFLPVGTDITLGGGISWLDEEESATVSIELTVLCVCTCTTDKRRYWYVLDGKRGGEKLKGVVYIGGAGLDLKPDDIVARSWVGFLTMELEETEREGEGEGAGVGECPISPVDAVMHSPTLQISF
ncbi:hypothetical protein BXZ70DRAFT_1005390 [Cristinia sonorae]|uniref:F-box domain-containing protein n=1 Tax=Cristinia sonorae TaxID=1940300 RepID=A0A8K0UVU7_9AGAR|nr:hypothetical protein BXZ70DRAFT_1005390 [Cristinia sonorae]